jgi:hypothetical protein
MCRLLVMLFVWNLYSCKLSHRDIPIAETQTDTAKIPSDSTQFYFPERDRASDTSRTSNALDSFSNSWYSKILFRMHEPLLHSYRGPDNIFRLTLVMSFDQPISILMEKKSNGVTLSTKVLDGTGGYDPGQIMYDTLIEIEPNQWDSFVSQIRTLRFWDLMSDIGETGDDGSQWVLEGYQDGKYHFVDRWTPDQERSPEFRKVCETLLELSGVKSVVKHIY